MVQVLPQITLYRPGHGRLLQFQSVPSKLKVAKKNITTMLANPTKFFKFDPNGFVMVLDKDPAPQQAKAKEEAKQLRASTGGLFEKLMSSAGVKCAFLLASLVPVTDFTVGATCLSGSEKLLIEVFARALLGPGEKIPLGTDITSAKYLRSLLTCVPGQLSAESHL